MGFWDGFWDEFGSSRCKTTLMIITIIITLFYCTGTLLGRPIGNFYELMILLVSFWLGRFAKAQEVRKEVEGIESLQAAMKKLNG